MEYVIQENLFKEQHYNMLFSTLDRLYLKYTTVRVYPFVDKIIDVKEIPDGAFDVDDLVDFQNSAEKVFVFGAIKFARIARDRNWKPGSMMNDNHDFLIYSKYYKDHLLNIDSEIRTLKDNLNWKKDEVKFIRPTKDTKSFTGNVFNQKDWEEMVENYLHNYKSSHFNEQTEIQVSSVKNIYKEIRFWVVDGKIVTGSQYKLGHRVIYDNVFEYEAIEFAQNMLDLFQLNDAFVIDVCLTDKGWKIVECGCINCAGFYKADLQKIIIALEKKFD